MPKSPSTYDTEFAKFIQYLDKVDIDTLTLRKRTEFIYTLCRDMCTEKIEDVFVTEYIAGDGSREYENLWFLSKS